MVCYNYVCNYNYNYGAMLTDIKKLSSQGMSQYKDYTFLSCNMLHVI